MHLFLLTGKHVMHPTLLELVPKCLNCLISSRLGVSASCSPGFVFFFFFQMDWRHNLKRVSLKTRCVLLKSLLPQEQRRRQRMVRVVLKQALWLWGACDRKLIIYESLLEESRDLGCFESLSWSPIHVTVTCSLVLTDLFKTRLDTWFYVVNK